MTHKIVMVFLTSLSFLMMFLSERPLSFAIPLWGLLIALSYHDLKTYRLPNILNGAIFILGIGFNIYIGQYYLIPLISFAIALVTLGAIAFFYYKYKGLQGMGLGDIKLFAAGAIWIIPTHLPFVLLLSSTTAIIGTIFNGKNESFNGKKTKIPFGPYLAFAIWSVWLFERSLNQLFL